MKVLLALALLLVSALLLLVVLWPSETPRLLASPEAATPLRGSNPAAVVASERRSEGRKAIPRGLRSVRVEVVDSTTGNPVPSCSVAWSVGGEGMEKVVTGTSGSVILQVDPEQDVRLSVDQPGYRTEYTTCEAGAEGVRFALIPVLRGMAVSTRRDELPTENVWAIAWKEGEKPPLSRLWEEPASSTAFAIGSCGSDGRFEIPVDSVGCRYVVSCGGQGWAMNSPRTVTARPTDDPVTVHLYPVHGALVTFRTDAGAAPRLSPQLSALAGTRMSLDGNCDSIHVSSPGLVLAGLDPSWLEGLSRLDHAVFCTIESLERHPGSLRIDWNVIGYEPTNAEVPLTFLGNGIDHSIVSVQPLSEMDARIVVVADPEWAGWMDSSSLALGGLRLFLHTPDGRQEGVFVLGGAADDGTMVLNDLPRGSFLVRIQDWENETVALVPPGASDAVRQLPVRLSNEPVVIDLRHLSFGAVEFDIRTQDGGEYKGPAAIGFGKVIPGTRTRSSVPFVFRHRPYRIPFAGNGTYGALLERPRYQNISHEGSYTFFLSDGQLTRIVIDYEEREILR